MNQPSIHPTAQISPGAEIERDVEIGPWCIVGPRARIGKGTKLLSHVVIDGWTHVGEGNTFHPFSVMGGVPQDLKYKGEATQLVIGNGNTIRELVTIHLGTQQGGGVTKIGNGNLIMANSHIGHDCQIGDGCVLSTFSGLAGHVIVEDFVTLAGMVGVSQFQRIGTHAYVGGQSGLDKDIPPYTIALGYRPCTIKGCNIVGMKRKGFSTDTIQKVNEAIKLWIRPDVPKEQCLLEIESQYGEVPEVARFVRFARESESGVVR